MSDMNLILNNYNQLLEELMKLFPDETKMITSIMIMEDDIKMQSIDLFSELLQDDQLFTLFLQRKIKVFSSKTDNTKNLSTSLFGSTLTLKNIFNNQPSTIKSTLWTYLQVIYLTKLMENKGENQIRINMLESEIKNASMMKEQPIEKQSNDNQSIDTQSIDTQSIDTQSTNPLNLDVNGDTNNMINDIISSFESKLQQGQGNPLNSIMEITEMINNKYQDKINNGDIEIEKLLENVTGSVPGLDKMMGGMMGGASKKPKEKVIIDENFSTDMVQPEVAEEKAAGPDMAKMMGMFDTFSKLTDSDGNMDINSLMSHIAKDANMNEQQTKQMKDMMGMIDQMNFDEMTNIDKLNEAD